ncbi:MAG: N-6 DNA methylase [Desulfurococcaceae archaeon]
MEVLRKLLNPNPRLLALWFYCKRVADEHGVPDVCMGKFPKPWRELQHRLWELRSSLENRIRREEVEYVENVLRLKAPEELYTELLDQDSRRSMGEFFTPPPIARRMISFYESGKSVFDIGTGAGVFLRIAGELGYETLVGIEVSPVLCDIARYNLRNAGGRVVLIWGDFLVEDDLPQTDLWVSNPPYTRHQQIPPEIKEEYASIIARYGFKVSRISSLYVYFFAKVLHERSKWKKASFICPRPLYDSVHSEPVKRWLLVRRAVSAVEVFHEQRVFEEAETGPAITYLDSSDSEVIVFRNCLLEEGGVKVLSERYVKLSDLDPVKPWTNIAINGVPTVRGVLLRELFEVMRGVATGANDYFVLSEREVKEHSLPRTVLIPCIAKTRYCLKTVFTREDWEKLRADGREVYLLNLSKDENNPSVRRYIELGEKMGVPSRSLVKTRRKWYYVEKRDPPPIFVTYLSRGRPRFILNEAGVVPLNVFLCLYPRTSMSRDRIVAIWRYLNSEEALEQFRYLARNYGEDTMKIEPETLGLLIIPHEVAGSRSSLLNYVLNRSESRNSRTSG